jgi:hypothetical protein
MELGHPSTATLLPPDDVVTMTSTEISRQPKNSKHKKEQKKLTSKKEKKKEPVEEKKIKLPQSQRGSRSFSRILEDSKQDWGSDGSAENWSGEAFLEGQKHFQFNAVLLSGSMSAYPATPSKIELSPELIAVETMFVMVRALARTIADDYNITILRVEPKTSEDRIPFREEFKKMSKGVEVRDFDIVSVAVDPDSRFFFYPLGKEEEIPKQLLAIDGVNAIANVKRTSDMIFCFLCQRKGE